jgi:hypothetical protein
VVTVKKYQNSSREMTDSCSISTNKDHDSSRGIFIDIEKWLVEERRQIMEGTEKQYGNGVH